MKQLDLFAPPPPHKRISVTDGAKDFIWSIRFYWENIHKQIECTIAATFANHYGTGNSTYTYGLNGYFLQYVNHACCLVLTKIGVFAVEAEEMNFIYTPHTLRNKTKTITI